MQNTPNNVLIHVESMRYCSVSRRLILFQLGGTEPPWSTTVGPAGGEYTRLRDPLVNLDKEGM